MNRKNFYQTLPFFAGIIVLATLIATIQCLLLPLKTFTDGGGHYTEYNNYVIFKYSFFHLIHHKDLYQLYPLEQWDLFKYSPTFALIMGPLAILPDWAGLFLWNLVNSMILFFAIWKLPFKNNNSRIYAILFILIELVTSLQNTQSNALIAGLVILAFLAMEKKQLSLAALLIVCTVFIKIFGLVAISMFLLYNDKIKVGLYFIGWFLLLGLLPLVVISPDLLIFLYKSWGTLLHNDQVTSYGLSVMGWLYTWFHLDLNKSLVVLLGAMLFCVPFINYKFFKEIKFRVYFLSSILLWIIIFNHRAESPTFIIAAAGIAIWYFYQEKKLINTLLVIFAFIFTILSATDIFPTIVKRQFLEPYVMKAVPCILIWFKISWDLIFYKREDASRETNMSSIIEL